MTQVEGGCLCGQIRYRANAEGAMTAVCHCKSCQRQSGTAFSVLFVVPKDDITIQGETKVFNDLADSGNKVMRHFCPNCGSPVISKLEANPAIVAVKAGTLDDASWLKPALHVWCASKQPWVELPEHLPRFDRNPG
ncbi:MAG: GFA family protein [Burkholderiales bacterium]